MTNLDDYYRVLELEPGASPEEIHQGYKDLAMVWHPDRFPNNPRLQQKAHKKLQEINEAHQQLRHYEKTAHSESDKTQSSHSQSNSKDFYKQATYGAKTKNYKRDIHDYMQWNNLNRKDVYVWLD